MQHIVFVTGGNWLILEFLAVWLSRNEAAAISSAPDLEFRSAFGVDRTWATVVPRLHSALLMWWTAPAPGIEMP